MLSDNLCMCRFWRLKLYVNWVKSTQTCKWKACHSLLCYLFLRHRCNMTIFLSTILNTKYLRKLRALYTPEITDYFLLKKGQTWVLLRLEHVRCLSLAYNVALIMKWFVIKSEKCKQIHILTFVYNTISLYLYLLTKQNRLNKWPISEFWKL
jgi:hypothetical protein